MTYHLTSLPLERDIVIEVSKLTARGPGIGCFFHWSLSRRRLSSRRRFAGVILHGITTTLPGTTLPGTTGIQHLHFIAYNFRRISILTFFILPFSSAQAAFQIDLGALAQIFTRNFRQAIKKYYPVPLGSLLRLAGLLVLPCFGGCNRDIGNCGPGLGVPNLRIISRRFPTRMTLLTPRAAIEFPHFLH